MADVGRSETPTLTVEQEMAGWYIESGVTCVVAPCCGFTFDAGHTDVSDGRYSCPTCPTCPTDHASS